MNVGTLRDLLAGHDDAEPVFIAYQPSWPLAASLQNVTSLRELDDDEEKHLDDHHGEPEELDAVWLVAGDAPYPDPYAPRSLFTGVMW